ncbi:conjugal transfer protein TraF [Vibrio breoganii]
MKTKLTLLAAIAAATSLPASANFDTRSFAMGGVGVSSSKYLTAFNHNPALTANFAKGDSFGLLIPTVGAHIDDEGDTYNLLDTYSERYDDYTNNPNSIDSARDLINTIEELKGTQFQAQANVALAVSIPNRKLATTLYINSYLDTVGRLNIDDNDTDESNLIANPNYEFQSSILAMGVAVTEFGGSFAREHKLFNQTRVLYGTNLKYQQVQTINYQTSLYDADFGSILDDEFTNKKGAFNMDAGTAYIMPSGISFGFNAKNLISHEYETIALNGVKGTYKITPTYTVGASYAHRFFSLAVDYDINKTERFTSISGLNQTFDSKKDDIQYLKAGAEFDLFGFAQLRGGYKHDLAGNTEDTYTAGIGLSPFGIHLDLSASYSGSNQYGAAFQAALMF